MGGNKSKIEDKDRIDERAVMDTKKVAVYHLNYDEDNTGLVQENKYLVLSKVPGYNEYSKIQIRKPHNKEQVYFVMKRSTNLANWVQNEEEMKGGKPEEHKVKMTEEQSLGFDSD